MRKIEHLLRFTLERVCNYKTGLYMSTSLNNRTVKLVWKQHFIFRWAKFFFLTCVWRTSFDFCETAPSDLSDYKIICKVFFSFMTWKFIKPKMIFSNNIVILLLLYLLIIPTHLRVSTPKPSANAERGCSRA